MKTAYLVLLLVLVSTSDCKIKKKEWTKIEELIEDAITKYDESQPESPTDQGDVLLFRGNSGSGGDPYNALLNGIGTTDQEGPCSQMTKSEECQQHYRRSDVESFAFCKIKYSLYKDNEEAAYVTFKANHDFYEGKWFAKDKIIDSSWKDLKTKNFNYFSSSGHNPGRRFFINVNYGGCHVDAGYTIALTDVPFGCPFDKRDSYPQYMYSTANGGQDSTVYNNGGYDLADFVTITGIRCK